MTVPWGGVLLWSPRLLALSLCVLSGRFALAAFSAHSAVTDGLLDFTILMAPTLVLCGVVALAWHRAWVGGIAFVALALAYLPASDEGIARATTTTGALLALGALYFWSWVYLRRQAPKS